MCKAVKCPQCGHEFTPVRAAVKTGAWTTEEDELLLRGYQKERKTIADLAEELDRSQDATRNRLYVLRGAGKAKGVTAAVSLSAKEFDEMRAARTEVKNARKVVEQAKATERKTRREIIRLMKDKTVVSVIGEINKLERELGIKRFRKIFKTITVDNGSEFSDPAALETGLQGAHRTKLFYCHAYHSCERGSNENANGLIRRHFPKGMSFAHTSRKAVAKVEAWLNHYPREILGWYSSGMLFDAELARL